MMNRLQLFCIFGLSAIVLFAGCSKNQPPQNEESLIQTVEFNLPSFKIEDELPDTRVTITRDGSSLVSAFEATDTLGVYPSDGSQIYFKTAGTEGVQLTFDGGAWKMKTDATYYSYYPFVGNIYLDKTRVPVSFDGQVQHGLGTSLAGARASFACTGTLDAGTQKISFNFLPTNCYININATLPAGTYKKMCLRIEENLFVKHGTVDITQATPSITGVKMTNELFLDLEDATLAGEGVLAAYMACAPVDLNGKVITIYFLDSEGFVYKAEKTPSKAYVAGTRYGLSCTPALDDGFSFGVSAWGTGDSFSGDTY